MFATKFLSSSSSYLAALSFLVLVASGAANDKCQDGVEITTFPFSATGDTTDATVDFETPSDNFRNLTCGVSAESRGEWYRVVGSDHFVQATLTDAPNSDTNFNVALFQGDNECKIDGEDWKCLLSRQYELVDFRTEPKLTWFAKQGVLYHFHVTGTNAEAVGPYTLTMEKPDSARPANDHCDAAHAVDEFVGPSGTESFTGDSTGSWPHGLSNDDCSLHPEARGLFYHFTGNGHKMPISASMKAPGAAPVEPGRFEAAILSSDCQSCIMVKDFMEINGDETESFEFQTVNGREYVLVVSGEGFADVGEVEVKFSWDENDSGAYTGSKGFFVASLCVAVFLALIG